MPGIEIVPVEDNNSMDALLALAISTEHQTPQAEIHSEPSNLLRTASPPPAWSSIHIVDI